MYRRPPTPAQRRALDALVAVEAERRRREALEAMAPPRTVMDDLADMIRLLDVATGCHAPRNLVCNQGREAA